MAQIYDSSHSGQEIDAAVDAVQTTIPSQLTQIGSKIGDLTELETTDKTDLVSAINEVKDNSSTTAEDTTYEDNYGIGADNVQDAIDKIAIVGYEEVLTATPTLSSKKSYASAITAGTAYRISFSNVSEGSKVSVSIGSSSASTEATPIHDTIVTEGMSEMYTPSVDATHWRLYVATASCTVSIDKMKTIKDIDDVPQKGSKSLVLSGGVYSFMPHINKVINATSEDFEVHEKNAGSNNWISTKGASHIVIPVIVGTEVNFTCVESSEDGNWYAWLNDTYVPPTSENKVPYVSGYSREWGSVGMEKTFTVPEGAAYLMLGTVDGNGNTGVWNVEYVADIDLYTIVEGKASIEQLEADKAELESEIEKVKYNLRFDDVWSTNDSSVIYPTRDGDNMVITTTASTGLKRCGFDISSLGVGESIYVDFTSDKGIVFGVGETLGSTWINVGTFTSGFYFTKTSATQKYLYIPANSYASVGVVLTLVGFKVYRKPDALKTEIDTLSSYSFQPSSYIPIKEGYERYMSISATNGQGSTIFGDYFVNGFAYAANYKFIKIYNLLTKELIQQVDLPTLSNTRYHANTISFSGTKYDNVDVFPLLYICSGYTDTTSVSTSEVYVVRIVGTEGSWTTELVQTITLDFGRVNSWTEWVCDPIKNRAWINGSGIDKYICVAIPDITESAVTINADTPIIDHFNTKTFTLGLTTKSSGQGRFFYHNRIYWVSGAPSYAGEGDEALYVVVDNTLTHCTEAVVPLKNFGLASGTSNTYEPEGCFIWNDEFYVAYRSYIAKLIQN